MTTSRNPLLDFMDDEDEQASIDNKNTQKWDAKGKAAFKKNSDIIPSGTSSLEENPLLKFINEEPSIHKKEENGILDTLKNIGNPLEQFKFLAEAASTRPKENIQAGIRGAKNIGEGLKQVFLGSFGKPGEEEKYTEEVEKERKLYNETKAGKSPFGKIVTNVTEMAPLAALPGGMAGSLIKKMLTGGLGLGAYEGLSFVPKNESRLEKTALGTAIGTSLPLGISAISKIPPVYQGVKNIVSAPFKNLKSLEQETALASTEAEKAIKSELLAKENAKKSTGTSNLNASLGKKTKQLSELEISEKSNLPVPSTKVSQEKLEEATKSHEKSKKLVSDIESEIDKSLNKGQYHPEKIGESVNKKINSIEEQYSNDYKKLMSDIEYNQFEMPDIVAKNYKSYIDSLKEKSSKSEVNNELISLLNKAPTSEDRSASVFLNKYKEFRDARFNLSQRLKDEPSHIKREEIVNALKDSKEMEVEIKKALEKGLGNYSEEFLRINKGYSDIIFPLKSYRLSRTIRNTGKSPKNMMEALTGSSAYTRTQKGQQALRDIVENDPELLKNILGLEYKGKIGKLHEPNELIKPYINKIPGLKDLLSRHKESLLDVYKNEENLLKYKKEHEKLVSQEQKAHETVDKKEKLIKNQTEKKSKLENEIIELDENIKLWKKESDRKEISLKRKMELEKKLEEAKKKRSNARKMLTHIVIGGVAYKYGKGLLGLSKENGEQ